MRVLYLCHRLPYPPNKGDKIRAFHELRALSECHEVDLFTLVDDPADLAHRDALNQYCRTATVACITTRIARLRSAPFLLTSKPLTVPYFYSRELKAAVRKAVAARSYDRILVYCSAMAQYVDFVDDTPIVSDFVDVDSDKWRQYASFSRLPMSAVYRREAFCLGEYERNICRTSASVVLTTEREANLLRSMCDDVNVHVIANGVDTAYFNAHAVQPQQTDPTIIFTGDMSYFPNEEAVISFATTVFPIIRGRVADTRFVVVGRNPGEKVRKLGRIPGVEVTGFVPDVRTYLAKAHVAVAPFTIAAGIQNKILEAMGYGLPVVATSRATQGLVDDVASVVHTGDTADMMAMHIVRLLRDPDFARQQGAEARIRVASRYDWTRSLDEFLQVVEDPYRKHISAAAGSYSRA